MKSFKIITLTSKQLSFQTQTSPVIRQRLGSALPSSKHFTMFVYVRSIYSAIFEVQNNSKKTITQVDKLALKSCIKRNFKLEKYPTLQQKMLKAILSEIKLKIIIFYIPPFICPLVQTADIEMAVTVVTMLQSKITNNPSIRKHLLVNYRNLR